MLINGRTTFCTKLFSFRHFCTTLGAFLWSTNLSSALGAKLLSKRQWSTAFRTWELQFFSTRRAKLCPLFIECTAFRTNCLTRRYSSILLIFDFYFTRGFWCILFPGKNMSINSIKNFLCQAFLLPCAKSCSKCQRSKNQRSNCPAPKLSGHFTRPISTPVS